MSRGERATVAGISGAGSIALGAVLLTSRSDCSGNSEDPNACTFGDHARDFGVTAGGIALTGAGIGLLVAAIVLAKE
jgi:hypothetical protein